SVVTTVPAPMSEMAATPLRQPLNSRPCATSIAIATGCWHGAVDQRRAALSVFESIATTSLTSVRFTYTLPFPAATPDSGFPPRGYVWLTAYCADAGSARQSATITSARRMAAPVREKGVSRSYSGATRSQPGAGGV